MIAWLLLQPILEPFHMIIWHVDCFLPVPSQQQIIIKSVKWKSLPYKYSTVDIYLVEYGQYLCSFKACFKICEDHSIAQYLYATLTVVKYLKIIAPYNIYVPWLV